MYVYDSVCEGFITTMEQIMYEVVTRGFLESVITYIYNIETLKNSLIIYNLYRTTR